MIDEIRFRDISFAVSDFSAAFAKVNMWLFILECPIVTGNSTASITVTL